MPSAPSPVEGDDHGLGREIVDPDTQIAAVATDARAAARLEVANRRGTLWWVVSLVALVAVGEQTLLSIIFYSPVLADIAVEFGTADVVWVLTTFALAAAVLTPLMSKLADVYGKRRIMAVCSVIAAVGTLLCAVAPTFWLLLVGRVLTAASFAAAPLSVALMREVYPVRMRAMGIALATNGGGLMVIGGPLVAGLLANAYGVRSVFWLNFAICLGSAVLMLLVVPESPVRARTRVDYVGALLLGLGLFGLLIGLSRLARGGLGDPLVIVALPVGVVAAALWWQQQKRSEAPLVSVRLLRRRPMLATLSTVFLYCGVAGTVNALAALAWAADPVTAGYGFGLSPVEIALWAAPAGVLTVLAGVVVGLTQRSVGYRTHMIIAGFFWSVPAILLGLNIVAEPALHITLYALFGAAQAYVAAATALVLLATPADQRAMASGLNYSMQAVGGAVVQQIALIVLAVVSVGPVVGAAGYDAAGFRGAFLVVGIIGALGIVTSWYIPHGRRQVGDRSGASQPAPA